MRIFHKEMECKENNKNNEKVVGMSGIGGNFDHRIKNQNNQVRRQQRRRNTKKLQQQQQEQSQQQHFQQQQQEH